jgi:hypothetical protein
MHRCKDNSDIRTVNTMLEYLSGYGIDHHSRAIVDLMPYLVSKELPSFIPYLESRM